MDPLVIPIVGMLIPIIIVPTAMGIKHARYLREVEHAERMRAMELGRTLAEDEAKSPSPSGVAGGIGVGVPLGAMVLAFIASPKPPPGGAWYDEITELSATIWIVCAMVGVAGVIGGTILASMQIKAGRLQATPAPEKPAYDPDEFDVVGSRG